MYMFYFQNIYCIYIYIHIYIYTYHFNHHIIVSCPILYCVNVLHRRDSLIWLSGSLPLDDNDYDHKAIFSYQT